MNVILVSIGGFFGSMIRFYISDQRLQKYAATWIANVSGSILLAFIFHLYLNGAISDRIWLLLGVGFCGAYTTFSTFGNETLQFILEKRYVAALLYVTISLSVSLFAIAMVSYLF